MCCGKLASEEAKICLSKSSAIILFFGIVNGKNTLFTKNAQKMVYFQKKILYFFSTSRGGPDPKKELSTFFTLT